MTWLTLAFFAQFALVALVAPGLGIFQQRVVAKLTAAAAIPLALAVPLLIAVGRCLPDYSLLELLRLELSVVAFAVGVAGLSALAGRVAQHGGPILVSVAALAVLASPFWGNVVLGLGPVEWRAAEVSFLVNPNPLLALARELQFDWTHGNVLYQLMPRIGEDYPYTPPALRWVALSYAGVGLAAGALASLARPRGVRTNTLGETAHF